MSFGRGDTGVRSHARHATPQTEAALLQVARGKTVQAMRIALGPNEPPCDDDLARTLSLTVPVEEAWPLEATRMMVEHMDGKSSGGNWLESLLAEGYISLLDHVVDALQQGRIGFEAAQLVARIATADTEQVWVERAARRTFKHLREEVQAVELSTRLAGENDRSPPSEEHIEQMQALERAILSGDLLRNVAAHQARGDSGEAPQARGEASNDATPVQISGTLS